MRVPHSLAGRLALFCFVMALVIAGYLTFAEPVG
jgi:hypothetical protein